MDNSELIRKREEARRILRGETATSTQKTPEDAVASPPKKQPATPARTQAQQARTPQPQVQDQYREPTQATPAPTPSSVKQAVAAKTIPKNTSKLRSYNLKTFEHDTTVAIKQQQESLLSMKLAEQTKKQQATSVANTKSGHPFLLISFGVIGIFLIFSITFFYFRVIRTVQPIAPLVERQQNPTYLTYNQSIPILLEAKTELFRELQQQQQSNLPPQSITLLHTTNQNGDATFPTSLDLFTFLAFDTPSYLTRSLTNQALLGVYADTEQNYPFLTFKVASYERGFPGMLEWERSIIDNVAPLFGVPQNSRLIFRDSAVSGKNIRISVTNEDVPYIMYGFLDSTTITITTNPIAFKAVLDSYNSAPTVQK